MDLSSLRDVLSSRSYHNIADLCDELMLKVASLGIPYREEWPYAIHLLGHIFIDDMNSARFLWKTIPSAAKERSPELMAVWKIGQCIWVRDYARVYAAARAFEWSSEVGAIIAAFVDVYTKRMFQLLQSAYSTICTSDFALFMGMTEQDATNYALQNGWTLEPASRMLTVKSPVTVSEQKVDPGKLQRLTEYVFHMEH